MSKLSFRARALDASKPMPIYMAEELPDLPDYSAINRAVPQMPSGMQKEEECEHHLQRAIVAGLIIPTPEVSNIPAKEFYDKVYPANYKQPRQLIHMQPFTMEQDIPDYDMDSDDERWLQSQTQKLELSPIKFEEMMDRLEKSSGQTAVTLHEAKALLKEDDDLIIAVFDYWLNKRLNTQHPLILTVKTEHRAGTAANNPYLAFRRRTEKMQTRKNRKNDEVSYEKMLKLRRDLCRAVTLLELVKRREKIKREHVHLTVEVFEKRFQAKDFSGSIMAEATALKAASRPAFTPIFHNNYTTQSWNKASIKDEMLSRREKRTYKKRKHKSLHQQGRSSSSGASGIIGASGLCGIIPPDVGAVSSDEDAIIPQYSPEPEDAETEGQFAFRRNKLCTYHMPLPDMGNWPWCSQEDNGIADKRFRFTLTSLSNPRRCIGFARRRIGRGGRVILDRYATNHDDFWRTLDFSITEPCTGSSNDRIPSNIDIETESIVNNKLTLRDNSMDVQRKLNCRNEVLDNRSTNFRSGLLRTEDIKSEQSLYNNRYSVAGSSNIRTSVVSNVEVKVEIKQEESDIIPAPESTSRSCEGDAKQHKDDFIRSLRRDWLHYRPKTPPLGYEAPCQLLPGDDPLFNPSANHTFALEIHNLEPPSSLLDTSSFLTDPFNLNQFDIDVPITDTRQPSTSPPRIQHSLQGDKYVQIDTNTLKTNSFKTSENCTIKNDISECGILPIDNDSNERVAGCSSFNVTDSDTLSANLPKLTHWQQWSVDSDSLLSDCTLLQLEENLSTGDGNGICNSKEMLLRAGTSKFNSSTLTSFKTNNRISDGKKYENMDSPHKAIEDKTTTANGLITQTTFDGSIDVQHKKSIGNSYTYSSDKFSNVSSGISLHTGRTLTLNHSHSSKILEIPLANESENKLVTTEDATSTKNNKKSLARKNNLIMEVT